MKIICTLEERNNLMEVITAGCCWIGNGEGKKLSNGKKNQKVDIEKFKWLQILFIKKMTKL